MYVTSKPQLRIYDPPAVDTKYEVVIKDYFGNTTKDDIIYKTITTKADFKIYIAEDSMNLDISKSQYRYKEKSEGEAKLWAKLINTSKNGVYFEWILTDTIFSKHDSSFYFHTTNDSNEVITNVLYYYPYKYKLKLISTSPHQCSDTIVKELIVKESKMGNMGKEAFPKVFTPDASPGFNDFFYVKNDSMQSIEYLRLRIYNIYGHLVYEYNGKLAEGWKGWDGKTRWGLDAPTGVYYYYYSAYGYGTFINNNETQNYTSNNSTAKGPKKISEKGYFYLLRSKQ